jgi:hypothetical protein
VEPSLPEVELAPEEPPIEPAPQVRPPAVLTPVEPVPATAELSEQTEPEVRDPPDEPELPWDALVVLPVMDVATVLLEIADPPMVELTEDSVPEVRDPVVKTLPPSLAARTAGTKVEK